jgi:ribosomal protein L21E
MQFQIGDIVRVVLSSTSMSTHKRHLINETGIVVKDAEKQAYIVQFFHTGERVVFHSHHLIKEEDWINRQKRSI